MMETITKKPREYKSIKWILKNHIKNNVRSLWTYEDDNFTCIYDNYDGDIRVYTVNQMLKFKMIKHSKYYYETDRNGYTTNSSINPKMLLSKEELMKEEQESPKFNFDWHLDKVSKQITDLLKSKNKSYGNTALNPSNVFSKLDATEAICARLDEIQLMILLAIYYC
jgi:hypothetical protein